MIVSDRLKLRALHADDADWIATEIARPEVHQWLTTPPCPYTKADADAFISSCAEHPFHCVVVEGDLPCGVISITHHWPDAPADLGYWLMKSAWGRGVMTEATTALLDHFFQDHDAVESGWIDGNRASENVLTKLGFARTGETRPIHSHYHGRAMPVIRVRLDRTSWAEVSRDNASKNAVHSGAESSKR